MIDLTVIAVFCLVVSSVAVYLNYNIKLIEQECENLRENLRMLRDDVMEETNRANGLQYKLYRLEMSMLDKNIKSAAYAKSVAKITKQLDITSVHNPGVSLCHVFPGEAVQLERREDSG